MKKYTIILLALAVLLPKISLAGTALGVTNITAVKTSAIANNTYADGWKWIFNVTVPTGEDKLQMKFADWTNGAQSIPAGSNMHFYSAQSLNATSSDSAVSIDSANTYGSELILDPTKGQQVQVAVEIKVPTGTQGGSFSTSYGIQTTGTTTLPEVPKNDSTLEISINPNTYLGTKFDWNFIVPFVFNLKAQNDDVKITNLSASTTLSAGDITTAYLYDGGTLLDSVPVVGGAIVFSDINLTILKDSTKALSLRIGGNSSTTKGSLDVSILASGIIAVDSTGSTITTTGSAIFNTVGVQSAGVELSNPIINFTKTSIGNTASSSFGVSFSFTAVALGGEAQISSTDSIVIGIYVNDVRVTTATVGCSASPAGVSGNGYLIADGNTTRLSTWYSFDAPSEIYTPEGARVFARLESVTTNLGESAYDPNAYTTNSLSL